jgi:hypothetical protein
LRRACEEVALDQHSTHFSGQGQSKATYLKVSADEQQVNLDALLPLNPLKRGIDRVQLAVTASLDGNLQAQTNTRQSLGARFWTLSQLGAGRTCIVRKGKWVGLETYLAEVGVEGNFEIDRLSITNTLSPLLP